MPMFPTQPHVPCMYNAHAATQGCHQFHFSRGNPMIQCSYDACTKCVRGACSSKHSSFAAHERAVGNPAVRGIGQDTPLAVHTRGSTVLMAVQGEPVTHMYGFFNLHPSQTRQWVSGGHCTDSVA